MTLAATNNFLLPNATIIAETIAFLIVLWVLWRWVLPPLNRAVAQRQESIRSSIDEADRSRSEARETLERYRAELAQAREESRQILEDARQQAERTRQQLIAKAEQEADRVIESARQEAGQERAQIVDQLRQEMGELAVELASRIIGAELDTDRQLRLVDDYIAGLGPDEGAA